MKILAFTDLHNDPYGLAEIAKKAKKENPDLLVCCGDLSNFGSDLMEVGKKLHAIGKKIVIIPGNHESPQEIEWLCKKFSSFVNVHAQVQIINGVCFIGYGTGGFALQDIEFERKVAPQLKKRIDAKKKSIFITHAPIYGTKLDFLHRAHRGNKSTRKFIEEVQPDIVLCGHFHENEKKRDKIKKSIIVNPGFDGMIVEIK